MIEISHRVGPFCLDDCPHAKLTVDGIEMYERGSTIYVMSCEHQDVCIEWAEKLNKVEDRLNEVWKECNIEETG